MLTVYAVKYEVTEEGRAELERAAERFQERWQEAVESLESDLDNLKDYSRRLDMCTNTTLDVIAEARGYLTLAAQSLDALERLAR